MMLSRILNNTTFLGLLQVSVFTIAFTSLLTVRLEEMGVGDFWVNQVIPLPYWVSIIILICISVLMIPHLENKRFRYTFIFSAILLIVTVRMAFPTMFTSIPAYEPDTINYMSAVVTWINKGLDLGSSGMYQHDYPLSFLIAYIFVKLGSPIDTFWRIAPFIIYILDTLLIYLIVKEISKNRPKIAAISVFLFSFSSLGAWVSIHYCPDLLGSLFFLLCLYLTVKCSIAGKWNYKNVGLLLTAIVLLVLSHHLSTLYFIATVFGFALVARFFKNKPFGNAVPLLLIGVFAYTFWFAYGNLMYNDFFDLSKYFTDYGGYTAQIAQGTPLLILCQYVTYPLFIVLLSLFGFLDLLKIRSIRTLGIHIIGLKKPFLKLKQLKEKVADSLLIYNFGNVLNVLVFILGFAVSVIFNDRVLEILFIGFYPLASLTVLKYIGVNPSKKRFLLIILIFILIALVDTTRYYSSMQRRILYA